MHIPWMGNDSRSMLGRYGGSAAGEPARQPLSSFTTDNAYITPDLRRLRQVLPISSGYLALLAGVSAITLAGAVLVCSLPHVTLGSR